MSRCTMHDQDVECSPFSFCIPELLSNGTALPKTGVLEFYHVVSVDQCAVDKLPCLSFNAT